jgi:hypothetical protein
VACGLRPRREPHAHRGWGGIYIQGRHNRTQGFAADAEKYLEAALAGWRVVRLADPLITAPMVERLIAFVRGGGLK